MDNMNQTVLIIAIVSVVVLMTAVVVFIVAIMKPRVFSAMQIPTKWQSATAITVVSVIVLVLGIGVLAGWFGGADTQPQQTPPPEPTQTPLSPEFSPEPLPGATATFEPPTEQTTNPISAHDAYTEFLQQRHFEPYVVDTIRFDARTREMFEAGIQTGYAIVDIANDGIPVLVIEVTNREDVAFALVFTYDDMQQSVNLIFDIHYNLARGDLSYSQQHEALVLRSGFGAGSGLYEFSTLAAPLFTIYYNYENYPDVIYQKNQGFISILLTAEEMRSYIDELQWIQFKDIPSR